MTIPPPSNEMWAMPLASPTIYYLLTGISGVDTARPVPWEIRCRVRTLAGQTDNQMITALDSRGNRYNKRGLSKCRPNYTNGWCRISLMSLHSRRRLYLDRDTVENGIAGQRFERQ